MAYTPGLVAGTWVGARDPAVHFSSGLGTGAQLALPIIGGTLAEVERSSIMRKAYLQAFPEDSTEIDMNCEPRRSSNLIDRFLDVIFQREPGSVDKQHDPEEPERKEEEKGGFFQRLFPKKE